MRQTLIITFSLVVMGISALSQDLAAPPLRIKGAEVAKQSAAKQLAFDAYVKKMGAEVLSTESVKNISITTLGFDVPKFASKGDRIWETRVMTIEQELRAIIWINPQTKDVYFVCGPWSKVEKKEKK